MLVTEWLEDIGFPSVVPLRLRIPQPIQVQGCLVTFWHYLAQTRQPPAPSILGELLRELHELPAPPVDLPKYQPLHGVVEAILHSKNLEDRDRSWLLEHCRSLRAAYKSLDFHLSTGLIHGDAYRGNLLWDSNRAVLADWDGVSIGPREIDLVPTMQAERFGLPREDRTAFAEAYGVDITSWSGYEVLRDMREVSTLSALLRNTDPRSKEQLGVRILSLRERDGRQWNSF